MLSSPASVNQGESFYATFSADSVQRDPAKRRQSGLLNKLTPQIPIYFISLPFVLFGGLLISYFAVPSMVSQFAAAVPDMAFFR